MKPKFFKVKDHSDLIKNSDTKAVLNIDNSALNKYHEEREKMMKLSRLTHEHDRLNKEVTEIKQTLDEILDLLRKKV